MADNLFIYKKILVDISDAVREIKQTNEVQNISNIPEKISSVLWSSEPISNINVDSSGILTFEEDFSNVSQYNYEKKYVIKINDSIIEFSDTPPFNISDYLSDGVNDISVSVLFKVKGYNSIVKVER